jgi:GNAT superfamily N-acetyltransferase
MAININYSITDELSKIDESVVYDFLTHRSSWAQGRSFEAVRNSMENSLCFGAITPSEKLLGFGRVVSDYSVFAWVLDVFVLEEFRGNGIAKSIITAMMKHPKLQRLQRWGLVTKDMHPLYEKFGFLPLKRPEMFMEMGYKRHIQQFGKKLY